MVSVRRRKHRLISQCTGRSSSSVPLPSTPENAVRENPRQKYQSVNSHYLQSVARDQPVEVEQRNHIVHPSAKKKKACVQVDPENPLEVHAYLMSLKEDNRLELGPTQINKEMPVKEWMEKCYPHIFRVFPQDSKVFIGVSDKPKQIDALCSQYWFLYALSKIVSMDHRVSPDFVKSLGEVIDNLEIEGFDCRFMRSELIIVGSMMKRHLNIMLANRNVIATRLSSIEKELEVLREVGNEGLNCREDLIGGIKPAIEQAEEPSNKLQEDNHKEELNNFSCATVKIEYLETILEYHKKMFVQVEAEGKRLFQVVEKINGLHQGGNVGLQSIKSIDGWEIHQGIKK